MFKVIQVKTGYAVQNANTYVIVFHAYYKADAERVANKLNSKA